MTDLQYAMIVLQALATGNGQTILNAINTGSAEI